MRNACLPESILVPKIKPMPVMFTQNALNLQPIFTIGPYGTAGNITHEDTP